DDPMIVASPRDSPSDCTYARLSRPVSATEPERASPSPSRIDFLPRSITSSGISRNVVLIMKAATSWVMPSGFGGAPAALLRAKSARIPAALPASCLRVSSIGKPLERKVRPKLNDAAAADGSGDVAEIRVPQGRARVAELRRIGQAEGLAA